MKAVMLKIVHTINHENLAGGTFWNGNFDILIVFILWKLSGEFQTPTSAYRTYKIGLKCTYTYNSGDLSVV